MNKDAWKKRMMWGWWWGMWGMWGWVWGDKIQSKGLMLFLSTLSAPAVAAATSTSTTTTITSGPQGPCRIALDARNGSRIQTPPHSSRGLKDYSQCNKNFYSFPHPLYLFYSYNNNNNNKSSLTPSLYICYSYYVFYIPNSQL